jgi:hypothetical protein
MKTLMMTALMGALLVTATPALAGRDEALTWQINHTMAVKRAAQLELAKQQQQAAQTGLAGATGQPGKVGPSTEERQAGRAARQSLTDHP